MKITYKIVNIYVDKEENLIIIPNGESPKYGVVDLDIIFELNSPFSDDELEICLENAFKKCHSQVPKDIMNESSLERYLKIKGFSKAVKNRRLIIIGWTVKDGFYVTPTNKIPRRGFVHMKDCTIYLGKELAKGSLAKAYRQAILVAK